MVIYIDIISIPSRASSSDSFLGDMPKIFHCAGENKALSLVILMLKTVQWRAEVVYILFLATFRILLVP